MTVEVAENRKDSIQKKRNNRKSNSSVCLCVHRFSHCGNVFFLKDGTKNSRQWRSNHQTLCALSCGLVMGEHDDRWNQRDSHCPLDVTTATNVLAHINTRSLFSTTQTTHVQYAPARMLFHCIALHLHKHVCVFCAKVLSAMCKGSTFLALSFISVRVWG